MKKNHSALLFLNDIQHTAQNNESDKLGLHNISVKLNTILTLNIRTPDFITQLS